MSDPSSSRADRSTSGRGESVTLADFPAVVDRYEAALLRYAARLLEPDAPELEDVVQEAFVRLHRQIERHGPDSVQHLSTWLYRVTHNLARDVGRRRARQTRLAEEQREQLRGMPSAMVQGPATEDLVRREAIERAMAELDVLPEPFRETVVLKILHGMTLREIGSIMDCSIANVSYRLNQGLARLAERLRRDEII